MRLNIMYIYSKMNEIKFFLIWVVLLLEEWFLCLMIDYEINSLLFFFKFQTADEWHYVFYISAGIYLLGGVFYVIFASGNRQEWARPSETIDDNSNAVTANSDAVTGNISLSVTTISTNSGQKWYLQILVPLNLITELIKMNFTWCWHYYYYYYLRFIYF